jgi:hypothetical protein
MIYQRCVIISVVFFMLQGMYSCKKTSIGDAFKRTGKVVTIQRTLPKNITTITAYNTINVLAVYDTVNYLEITAGKNLLPKITTEVINGELILNNNNSFNWVRSFKIPINITIHTSNIKYLNIFGTGTITVNNNSCSADTVRITGKLTSSDVVLNTHCKVLYLDISTGTGSYTINGACNRLYAYTGAIGVIHLDNCPSPYIDFTNNSISDIYIHSTGDIYGQIYGLGNVYDSGIGTVKSLNRDDRGNYIKQ